MAGQSNREVTLTLAAQTNGTADVRALADEVRKLAQEGGAAAPEFEQLATKLDALAKQQDLVNEFKQLGSAMEQSRTAMAGTKDVAQSLSSTLSEQNAVLAKAREAEQGAASGMAQLQKELNESKAAWLAAKSAVSAHVAEMGKSQTATDEQKQKLQALKQAVLDNRAAFDASKASIANLTPEYTKLKVEAANAQSAVKATASELRSANTAAEVATADYQKLSEALHTTRTELEKAGVDAGNLASEQNRLSQSMASLSSHATELRDRMASASRGAAEAGSAIEQAFGVVGVRSTGTIKAEILKVNTALMTLAKDARVTGADFDRAFAAGQARIRQLEADLRQATATTSGFGSSITNAFKQFGPASLVFNGVTAALQAMFNLARDIPKVTAEFENIGRALTVVSGSSAKAREEFAYIKDVANRVGGDIKGMADAYISLSAATKGTALEGANTKRVFEAVSGAMGVLGKSSAETEGALRAIQQMVSKGTVSMEEFRQQLAERLPGAFTLLAKELNITTEELTTLISSGKLAAEDVMPALSSALEKAYQTHKKNDTLAGQWQQLTNAAKEYGNAIGEPILKPLLAAGRVGAATFAGIGEGLAFASKSLMVFSRELMTSRDWGRAFGFLREEADAVIKRMNNLSGLGVETAKTLREQAEAAKAAGHSHFMMADGVKMSTASVLESSNTMTAYLVKAAKMQHAIEIAVQVSERHAEGKKKEGESILAAANALGSETDKRRTATIVARENEQVTRDQITNLGILLKLKQEEADKRAEELRTNPVQSEAKKQQLQDLSEEITKLQGKYNELVHVAEGYRILGEAQQQATLLAQDNKNVVTEARDRYIELRDAVVALTAAQQAGADVEKALSEIKKEEMKAKSLYIDALKDEAEWSKQIAQLSGNERDARQASLVATQKHLQALREMGEGRSDEARKIELQVTQMEIERRSMEDNSRQLYSLRAAYKDAAQAVEELRQQKAAGADVSDRLASAEREAAKAATLYKDALRDQGDSIRATLSLKQESLNLEQADIQVRIESLRTVAEVARLKGDEKAATAALVEIKKLEIELARLTAEAKRAEAQASIELIRIKREELQAAGDLTESKRRELAAQEKAAEVKMREADISDKLADRLAALAKASKETAKSSDDAASGSKKAADGFDAMGDSAERAAEKVERLNNGVQKTNSGNYYNQDGMWSDKNGQTQTAHVETDLSLFNMAKQYGMDDAQAQEALRRAKSNANVMNWKEYVSPSMSIRNYAEELTLSGRMGNKTSTAAPATSAPAPSSSSTASGTPGGPSFGTVNVKMPQGDRIPINVATPQDAANVRSVIERISGERSRAGGAG